MAILILILIFICLYLLSHFNTVRLIRKFWVYGEKIPGPVAHPIFGNASMFIGKNTEEMFQIFKDCANEVRENGGNLMRMHMMGKIYVWPLNGKTAAKILESTTEINKGDDYAFLYRWLGRGLLLESGETWKTHRKIITPAFHFAKLDGYMDIFNSETKLLIEIIDKFADSGDTVDMFPYIKRCALDIICRTAMGTKINAQLNHNHAYIGAVQGFLELAVLYSMNPLMWNKLYYRLMGYQKRLDDDIHTLKKFTNDVISERRAAIASGEAQKETSKRKMNFLDILLDNEESNVLSEEDIRQEVDTFMFAGHDTTTTSLSWLIWNLAHNPDIQQKVYEELVQVFGTDPHEDVLLDKMSNLPYTERVLKESKRICAPVPGVQRKLTENLVLDGITIPSEGNITISPAVIHENKYVYENPEKFDPDRFLPEEISKRHTYDYIPFSAGLRNCIGQKFAQLNEKVMLVLLMKNYRFEPMLDYNGTRPCFEVVAKPSKGIPVKLIRR